MTNNPEFVLMVILLAVFAPIWGPALLFVLVGLAGCSFVWKIIKAVRYRPNIIRVVDELDDHSQDLAYPTEFAKMMGEIRKDVDRRNSDSK